MAVDRFQLTVEAMTRGEQDLARLENAVNRFSAAADRAGKGSSAMSSSFEVSGQKVRDALVNPLGAAQTAVDGLLGKLGTAGKVIGATGAIAGTAAVGIFNLARAYGDLYEQQSNNAIRLGVTIREYGLLDRVSKEAGLSGDALVGTMRGLSNALADTGEDGSAASNALRRLGVSGTDSFGAVRPMRDLLLDIADKLGGIQNPAERAEIAMKVLGRSGLEVLPLMNSELRTQIQLLEASGAGWTTYGEKAGAAADKAMDAFDRRWSAFTKELKRFGAETFLSATDPGVVAGINRDRRNDRRDFQNTQGLRLLGQFGYGAPGVTDDQMAAMARSMVRSQISQSVGTDPKDRLSALRAELQRTIKEAAGPDDVARVRQLTAEIRALEASIKGAEEAAKRSEKLRQYAADVVQAGLMRAPAPNATGFNILSGAPMTTWRGPSLLRPGESVNRGTLGTDPAQFEATQQRALEAARATVQYQSQKLALLAGPGGEIAAVQTATALKLAALEREREFGVSIFELERERLAITREGELSILEIQKRRQEANRQTGASIFDALLSGGAGVKGYASSLGLGVLRTTAGNAYDMFAGGLGGRLSTTNNPDSFLGRLFANTPLGANSAAQAGAVQLSAGQLQLQAGTKMMAAAAMMGGGFAGVAGGGSLAGLSASAITGISYLPTAGAPKSSSLARNLGLVGAGAGAAFGAYSGFRQGGASGALTATASLAGGVAAILPALLPSLSLAGPIGGAIAIGATLAMAFLPDPKETRRRSLEEQARQRQYEEAVGTEYVTDMRGRAVDYSKRGETRVYLSVNAMDAQSIIDRQEDIGEAVRQALSSYPPLAMDLKGATLGV